MIYNIVYDAVKKKTMTNPPNIFIGNVEMAAGIGMVLAEIGRKMDFENIKEPVEIKENFERIMEETENVSLSDTSEIIVELIEKYQVREMVNETMEDLEILVNMKNEDTNL